MYNISNFVSETEFLDFAFFFFLIVQSQIHSKEEKEVNAYGKTPKKMVLRLIAFWQRLSSGFTKETPVKCEPRGRAQDLHLVWKLNFQVTL